MAGAPPLLIRRDYLAIGTVGHTFAALQGHERRFADSTG